jgi:DNA (cytosine-5)-methyltransferase 1
MNMKYKPLRHASLFTGIGGFDLAASWMGWENVFQCEIDPFCQKLLQYWFPEIELFSDIKTSNFTNYHGKIDVISGGFPCQPFSVAGKQKGTNDNRYLWPEMLRVLREVNPQWVVIENVCGLLALQSGMVFERVYADLENAGYKVQPYIIPACAVGAPHRRDRVWIVAHANVVYAAVTDTSTKGLEREINCRKQKRKGNKDKFWSNITGFSREIAAYIESQSAGKLQNKNCTQGTHGSDELFRKQHPIPNWDNFPAQSPVCIGNDGLPGELADISFSKWRNESIKALGNAIVPQVAYQIFKAIETVTR